jgi:phosphatidylserine/phosphatidylglycerophosphate/cardiolipin synthase-like enzyme
MTFAAMIQSASPSTDLGLVSPAWKLPVSDARFAGEPVRWIRVTDKATGAVALAAFADAALRAFLNVKVDKADARTTGLGDGSADVEVSILELTPLPRKSSLRTLKSLTAGLPVQYVVLRSADYPAAKTDSFVARGASLFNAGIQAGSVVPALVGVCFQDRITRDPAAWGALIGSALTGADATAWSSFRSAVLDPVSGRTLYLLDHVGRPLHLDKASGLSIQVAVGTSTFTGTRVDDGAIQDDTGQTATLPDGGAATIPVALPGGGIPLLARVEVAGGSVASALGLARDERHVQLLDVDAWLAKRDPASSGLARYRTGNFIEPLIDGVDYFERLYRDLGRVGAGGGVDFAGWAFDAPLKTVPGGPWLLSRQVKDSDILSVLQGIQDRSGRFRFLVNQFLDPKDIKKDGFAELSVIALALLLGLTMGTKYFIPTDWSAAVGVLLGFVAYAIAVNVYPDQLFQLIANQVESSTDTMAHINAIASGSATWSKHPAEVGDNPFVKVWPFLYKLAADRGILVDVIDRLSVYHMKMVAIDAGAAASGERHVAYVGGMDLVPNRLQTPLHRVIAPFHDVQARITGPAFLDIATTFDQRLTHDHGTAPARQPAIASLPGSIAATGTHLVQIGRTLFAPRPPGWGGTVASGDPFSFATTGESSTYDTMVRAIAQARDLIYIEDQYFTPNAEYVAALETAANNARALVITLPPASDQMFGNQRRLEVLARLRKAWGSRLYAGAPVRRYRIRSPKLISSIGRCRLTQAITSSDSEISVAPQARLPEPPFWAFIGGELVFCTSWAVPRRIGPNSVPRPELGQDAFGRLNVVRSDTTYKWGGSTRSAKVGDPVTIVQLPGIYVHAKVLVVDDVFVGVGSTNINRRGFFQDGELHAFAVPEHLKRDPSNPARLLRTRLWAEHLGIPPEMGPSLLADPISALPLFGRAWFSGSSWQPIGSLTGAGTLLDVDYAWGDGIAGNILLTAVKATLQANRPAIWSELIDPTSFADPDKPASVTDPKFDDKRGPGLP